MVQIEGVANKEEAQFYLGKVGFFCVSLGELGDWVDWRREMRWDASGGIRVVIRDSYLELGVKDKRGSTTAQSILGMNIDAMLNVHSVSPTSTPLNDRSRDPRLELFGEK